MKTYIVKLWTHTDGKAQIAQALADELKAQHIQGYEVGEITHPRQLRKEQAIWLLANEIIDPAQALIVCKGFATDDEDFVEVLKEDIDALTDDDDYDEFEIWLISLKCLNNSCDNTRHKPNVYCKEHLKKMGFING